MNKVNLVSFAIIILGVLVSIFLILGLDYKERSLVNISSIIGSVASIFGLIVAVIQIISVKKISKITQQTVEATKAKLIHGFVISDVSKAIKLIEEIQNYIGHKDYQLTLIRLRDLRFSLVQFGSNNELISLNGFKNYKSILADMNVDIVNIFDLTSGKKKSIDISRVNRNLENLTAILIQFETNLKFHSI